MLISTLDKSISYDGNKSMKISYQLGNGLPQIASIFKSFSNNFSGAQYLSLWIKPDSNRNQIKFSLYETNGRSLDLLFCPPNFNDSLFNIPLSNFSSSDGSTGINFDELDRFSISILQGSGIAGTGTLYIDAINFSTLTDVSGVTKIPTSFKLFNNYPNPFNNSTHISYEIPGPSHIKLIVYDILGNEVETLVNEFQNAGIYTISWNADKLSSGIYFLRLQSQNYSAVKKAVLLK